MNKNCKYGTDVNWFNVDQLSSTRVRQSRHYYAHNARHAFCYRERASGRMISAIRSVSLITKSVLSVRNRLLIENYPRVIARTVILRGRGPVGAGSSRRPLISTVSGPVLDTMGPKVCPTLPSRCPLPFEHRPAACYTRGKAEHVRNLRA